MIREGLKNVTAGANPVGVRKGMEQAVTVAIENLKEISKPIEGKESIAQVAAISAADEEVGSLIAEAMERVGNDGVITIEESKGFTTELEVLFHTFTHADRVSPRSYVFQAFADHSLRKYSRSRRTVTGNVVCFAGYFSYKRL